MEDAIHGYCDFEPVLQQIYRDFDIGLWKEFLYVVDKEKVRWKLQFMRQQLWKLERFRNMQYS